MENNKNQIFLKMALVGVAGVLLAGGISVKDYFIDAYENNKVFSNAVAELKVDISKGIGSTDTNEIVIKTGVDYTSNKNIWGSFATTDKISEGLCTVMLTAGGKLDEMAVHKRKFLNASQEEMDAINRFATTPEGTKKIIQITGLHEAYHCDEEVINSRFNIKGFPELTNSLNSLYTGTAIEYPEVMKYIGERKGLLMDGNLDSLLSEGYAEAASSIAMIQKYDNVDDVLKHRQVLSGSNRVSDMATLNTVLRKHTTDGINQYFRTPEGIKEAQSLTSVSDIREAAWNKSNENMLSALKSRGDVSKILDNDYWQRETINFWRTNIVHESKGIAISTSPIMNERIKELQSKLPEDLVDKFKEAAIAEATGKGMPKKEIYVVYSEVFKSMPELEAGSKEIKIIQEQLPQAAAKAKDVELYSAKSVKDIIKLGDVEPSLSLKLSVSKKDTDNALPAKNILKM